MVSSAESLGVKSLSRRAEYLRWVLVQIVFGLAVIVIVLRLWQLQVINHDVYDNLAISQREVYRLLTPTRGEIYATEKDMQGGDRLVPLAVNREAYLIYAEPRLIEDLNATAEALSKILNRPIEEILPIIDKPGDPFEPMLHRAGREVAEAVGDLNLPGVGVIPEVERFYPDNNIGSQLLGFVSYRDESLRGQYGIEGYFNKTLAGVPGNFRSESNAAGVWIALAERDFTPAIDGSDIILTIDRTIQFKACRELNNWVKRHGASGGSLIVMNPKTGAIVAMCGSPDFNPNVYNEINRIDEFNNPSIFLSYEPGSIMKPITMAAALDQQRVTATTTYNDAGFVTVGPNTIRNSDLKSYGLQTMTDVLTKSLNTGAIYAMRQVGVNIFRKYLEDFGFGAVTGIELAGEASGDINRLYEDNEIYAVTASFGQGVTVTPLQMVTAFSAIANGGRLMKPYVVKEVVRPDGTREPSAPRMIRQVITEKTAAILSGMLVTVTEEGHGKRAAVKNYFIAGKTGTAQIPSRDGQGYEKNATIGSFVGFGPVSDPKFAMIIRIDRPKDVRFAESSAAPLFGDIAEFILQYYEVPPDNLR